MSVWAAILAGGAGTRFWPLSTPERPKQLLPLAGDRPLLVQAVERLDGLVPPERILILTGPFLVDQVARVVPQIPRAPGARCSGRVRRARHRGREADAQRDGLRVHHPGEAAGRSAHRAALPREALPRPRGPAAPPGRALEHGAVRLGRGPLPGRSGRLRARAQARLARAHGGRRRGLLRRRPARGGGRGRVGADQTARGRCRDVWLGRHRLLGRPVAHSQAGRARQRGGRKGDGGGRRAPLGDLVRERARRRGRPGRYGGRAGQRPHARDAHRPRRALEGARAAAVTHALYLLDPDPAPAWAPFVGARPLCELRAGAHLIRERWETFVGAETAAIFALPHLAGFAEAGVPLVAARRPVPGPAVIGSSRFAPRGLAPSLPEGAFRLTNGGVTG